MLSTNNTVSSAFSTTTRIFIDVGRTLTTISVVVLCGIALCMLLPARKVSAQKAVAHSGSVYDPYPPGILPSDLNPEIERVLREIRVVEKRALAR